MLAEQVILRHESAFREIREPKVPCDRVAGAIGRRRDERFLDDDVAVAHEPMRMDWSARSQID